MTRHVLSSLALLLGFILPAHAVDGVIEINHAKILAGGGYPLTIGASGSYRLTGNLTQSNPTRNVINIYADDVTLDLNGFAIKGPGICSRGTSSVTCSYGGAEVGMGIDANDSKRVVIRNGRIVGMASHCISSGGGIVDVEDVSVAHCDGHGMLQVRNVLRSSANNNRLIGIHALDGMVTDSTATYNGNAGVLCKRCSGLLATKNNTGIAVSHGGVLENSVSSDNYAYGIEANTGALVRGNSVYLNPTALYSPSGGVAYQGNYFNSYTTLTSGASFHNTGSNFCNSAACP